MTEMPWPRCPEAAEYFESKLKQYVTKVPELGLIERKIYNQAGVLLLNLVDHWVLPQSTENERALGQLGLEPQLSPDSVVYRHPAARLPAVRLIADADEKPVFGVENIAHFSDAHGLSPEKRVGDFDSEYEEATYKLPNGDFGVAVRKGYTRFQPGKMTSVFSEKLKTARELLQTRERTFDDAVTIQLTEKLVDELVDLLGAARATDEFFHYERSYYTSRNSAARLQLEWQQLVGIDWANHDHHTYRSSREHFQQLIGIWLKLGFVLRERFYAGAEAGWGAQVMEHPASRVVLFSDVDIHPDELAVDFSTTRLEPQTKLHTIGLWCALHGDSIGVAGMHHLECEFDFSKTEELHRSAGQDVMNPFTNYPMLKQAFTTAERWKVEPSRITHLLTKGLISESEADRFSREGANGSHLEILQRKEGFKGFDKTGVSSVIRATDARLTEQVVR